MSVDSNEPDWSDITVSFRTAAQALEPGELVHDEAFSLFDAMSAIEMMDPKMDAGMLCNRKRVLGLEESIEAGLLKVAGFTAEERIGIIDETFACLVTWLEGNSFAQTVLTNLYLHNPPLIQDKAMRAVSFGVLGVVDFVTRFISRADVALEEDFSPFFDLPNLNPGGVKVHQLLREAEEDLQRKLKRSAAARRPSESEPAEPADANDEWSLVSALHARVKFTRELFGYLSTGCREGLENPSIPTRGQPVKYNPIAMVDELGRNLDQLDESLKVWKGSLHFGIRPCTESFESTAKGDYPTIMGFSPLVNQKLLPPTFPRYAQIKSRPESVDYMERLVKRLRHVLQIYAKRSFFSALNFVNEFTALPTHDSCVLTRSLLQTLYFPSIFVTFGMAPFYETLRDDAVRYVKPLPLLPKSPLWTSQSKELVEMFFRNCQNAMTELVLIAGHNRARQRKKLTQVLGELSSVLDDAVNLDSYFTTLSNRLGFELGNHVYFSTWAMHYVLRVCLQYLLSGFEQELYAPHEYPYIYFYLCDVLLDLMLDNVERASQMCDEHERIHDRLNAGPKSKKTRGGAGKQSKKPKDRSHQREVLYYQGLRFLCHGLQMTVSGLDLEGKLQHPQACLNDERTRYELRFDVLHKARFSPVVTYETYRQSQATLAAYCQTSADYYRVAHKSFIKAKEALEAVKDPNEEISNYLRVTKMNCVVNKLLIGGHRMDSKTFAEFDFSIDKTFPVIRVL